MMQSGVSEVRRVRRRRSISEKIQIVQLTMEPGASVAEVARDHGVNSNQVFKWRRAWERGELTDGYAALLPVSVRSNLRARLSRQLSLSWRLIGARFTSSFLGVH